LRPLTLASLLLVAACAPPDVVKPRGSLGSADVASAGSMGNGTNYYVAPTGADTNPCTAAAPCYSLARVGQLLQPGDNAHFAAGSYSWSTTAGVVAVSGTAAAPISYISDTQWGAKINGGCPAIWNDGDYVQIINFDVTASCALGITTNGSHTSVIGNHVHDLPANNGGYAGILVDCCKYTSVGSRVIGNVVHDIATALGQSNTIHGIYIASAYDTVENNVVYRAAGWGIQAWHCVTHYNISNNTVFNNFNGGIVVGEGGTDECPLSLPNDSSIVNNNIVYNNGTASSANGYGLEECCTGNAGVITHGQYNNNLVYGNRPADWNLLVTGGAGTNTVTAAPLFLNYSPTGAGDYHQAPGSPSIDAGTALAAPPYDYDGFPRPYGAAYDIGAYEWHP
jgi:hypothetical protein